MKSRNFNSAIFGLLFAAIGMVPTLRADPLVPGGSVDAPNIGSLTSGTEVASNLGLFSSGTVDGQVGVKVLSGVTSNVLGGLTFVYEVANLSTSGSEGLGNFAVAGWAGLSIDVVVGEGFFFTPNGAPVQQGFVTRSLDGNSILFDFPPGDEEPPIFAGQNSFQLIVYTNATAWRYVSGGVASWDYDGNGDIIDGSKWNGGMETIVAASLVPDAGTSALLLGLGFIVLALFIPRLNVMPVAVCRK